jgi:hypothetical protein
MEEHVKLKNQKIIEKILKFFCEDMSKKVFIYAGVTFGVRLL